MADKAVLLIPEIKFYKYCETRDSAAWPKIVEIIISKATGVIQKIQDEERNTVVVLSSQNKHNGDLLKELSKFEESHDAEIRLTAGMSKWAELLIQAKPIIDELDAKEISIILPRNEELKCRELVPVVLNKNTYNIEYIATDVNGNFNGETEKENIALVKKILSEVPSSDGLAIKTLKSRVIPQHIFYHGFTTRCGGVSSYPTMKSLPLAMSLRKKDTLVYIEENRRRLAEAEGFDVHTFECANAVHGVDVWIVGDDQPKSYDAIATNRPGITIAAPGADCQILLFCDENKQAVAAAHSGWKGTIDRIQQNVVRVMNDRFGCKTKDIHVSIGPSIGVCCYNVDEGRAQEFTNSIGKSVIQRRNGIAYLDLWKATVMLLEEIGIPRENIDDGTSLKDNGCDGYDKVTMCTQCHKDEFFSYRRDGPMFGNQIGFIGIKPSPDVKGDS